MVLKVNRLTRIFDGQNGIRNVSFTVEKGEIIGLLGKSGSGKSTILKAISGLDQEYSGEILIHNEKIHGPHKEIGVVFQEPRLFPWLTVLENVQFGLNGKKEENVVAARELLTQVGLKDAENLFVKQLSGGMAQRVAIARALVANPGLLLLDEPFSALDAFTKMQLQDLVLKIWETQSLSAVIVTHDIDEALYLCDRIIVLSGKPGQVEREFQVKEARPRNRGSETLARMKAEILQTLNIEAVHN